MKKGVIITIIILTALAAAIFFIVKSEKHPSVFPLKQGSRGEEVKKLQKYINAQNQGVTLDVDGIYGSKTQSAVYMIFGQNEVSKKVYNEKIA
ncbi:MAG: hypothetical protein M0R02_09355 [Bacteroidales bacterium]|nr:hypothetical protein [Bacteroidales bacterium]